MSGLKEIAPEPIKSIPGIPASLPKNGTTHPYLIKSINILRIIQQYSVIPFSGFSLIHLTSVVIGPSIFGPQIGDDLISVGREIYQVPIIEIGILVTAGIHVISGISINLLRRYYNYIKYGFKSKDDKIKKNYNSNNSKFDNTIKITSKPDDIEVKNINEGLGGISSIIGIGSRESITSKLFGLSPLSFSGYIFLILLGGHIYYERISPILIDGDSSMVDLSYVAFGLKETFWKTFTVLNLLVATGSYHILVGWNRYLKRFSLRQRKNTYITLLIISCLSCVSLLRIKQMDVFTSAAKRFLMYVS